MSRSEADREDLLAEAVGLPRRIECVLDESGEIIVAGIGRDDRLSVYFNSDPVFHFDAQNRLRRAFVDEKQYRSQGDTLAELARHRTDLRTVLQRRDLSPERTAAFLDDVAGRLRNLCEAMNGDGLTVLRRAPPEDSAIIGDIGERLRAIIETEIPLSPAIPGKP